MENLMVLCPWTLYLVSTINFRLQGLATWVPVLVVAREEWMQHKHLLREKVVKRWLHNNLIELKMLIMNAMKYLFKLYHRLYQWCNVDNTYFETNFMMGTTVKSRRQEANMWLFNRCSAGACPWMQKTDYITVLVLNAKNCVFSCIEFFNDFFYL